MHSKVAIVTGAGTGIGKACSIRLAEAEFKVVLVGRRLQFLEEVADAIRGLGGEAMAHPGDISIEADVLSCFQATVERYGRLDLLFNNAGRGMGPTEIGDLSLVKWQKMVDINLTGTFLCSREAFRIMKSQSPQGGRIINNGSVAAHVPRPYTAPYTATKHAITGLTKAISLEGRPYNIACGQIDIGNAESRLTDVVKQGIAQADGSTSPEPTFEVSHVADAVLYMANLPLGANVQFMTILATAMPYIGRG